MDVPLLRRLWRSILTVVSVAVVLAPQSCSLVDCSLVDWIPPRQSTDTALAIMRERLGRFSEEHQTVPTRLEELPQLKGREISTKDGWRREFGWYSDGERTVKVWSFGRDGKPGGVGDDADLQMTFVAPY